MIGPSDLNRFRRWMPERTPEDLRRYARSELGVEDLVLPTATRPSHPLQGVRLWLAGHVRPVVTVAKRSEPRPLGPRIGAVHFSGETDQGPHTVPAQRPAVGYATPARESQSGELCTCEL